MKIDNLIENYPDLEYYLEPFNDSKEYLLATDGKSAEIQIKSIGLTLKLSKTDLVNLSNSKRFTKPDFTFLNHCGYVYKDYGEVCISVFHPKYPFTSETQEWPANPLKLKISNKLYEIGSASPLFVLINEPIYQDRDIQYDFQNFTTIKVTHSCIKDIKDDIIKVMYYLNSHYLKSIGFVAKLYQMEIINDDPLNFWDTDLQDIFKKINRVRTRTRTDFISMEPLKLYNQAQLLNGDEKFLYLYRILEFFMQRARIRKVNEIRYDKNISDLLLLKTIDQKNQEMLLENLLNESLNSNQKKRISGYAFNCKLILEDKYECLTKSLYKYRNSIVHAKEQQIMDTKIPDPFDQNNENQPWINIVDDIVLKCIKKYNKPTT